MTASYRSGTPGQPAKYPMRDMKLGEERFFPGIVANSISRRAGMYKPMKFKCRTIVWRGTVGAKVRRIG